MAQNQLWCLLPVVDLALRVIDEGSQLIAETGKAFRSVKRFVESQKGDDGVRFNNRQPFIGCRVMSLPIVTVDFWIKLFGLRKRSRIRLSYLGPESRSVVGNSHVSKGDLACRKMLMQQRFEEAKVLHALRQAIANEHEALSFRWGERQVGGGDRLTTDIRRLAKLRSLLVLLLFLDRGDGRVDLGTFKRRDRFVCKCCVYQ